MDQKVIGNNSRTRFMALHSTTFLRCVRRSGIFEIYTKKNESRDVSCEDIMMYVRHQSSASWLLLYLWSYENEIVPNIYLRSVSNINTRALGIVSWDKMVIGRRSCKSR